MQNKNIVEKAIAELIPYANNARSHSDYQIGLIASSIQQFGFNVPILIDDNNTIISGHGRLKAAQKIKLETVPTIELSHLTEAQRKAFILADNKIAEHATWDEEMLASELDVIKDLDPDIDLEDFGLIEHEKIDDEVDNSPVDVSIFNLVVEFDNEADLQLLFDELKEKGFKCRPHII